MRWLELIDCDCLLQVWFSCDELGTDVGCPSIVDGKFVVMADWFCASRFGLHEFSLRLSALLICELANSAPPVRVGLESSGWLLATLSVGGATNRLAPVCSLFVEPWPVLADLNSTLN